MGIREKKVPDDYRPRGWSKTLAEKASVSEGFAKKVVNGQSTSKRVAKVWYTMYLNDVKRWAQHTGLI